MPRSRNRTRNDSCKKVFAVYECTNEDCKKKWQSYHGWQTIATSYQEQCGLCDAPGRVTDVKQEMTPLDIYVCGNCDHRWELIHHPSSGTSDDCPSCQTQTQRSGVQDRFATIVTFVCGNDGCRKTWTSPWLNKEFSQKCLKCYNRGRFAGRFTEERIDGEESLNEKPGGGGGLRFGGGGSHPPEGCDMCEVLKSLGKTCLGRVQLNIQERGYENGRVINSVTFVRNGRGPQPPRGGRGRGGPRGRGGQFNRSEVVPPALAAIPEVGPAINQQQSPLENSNHTPGPNNAQNRLRREAKKAKKLAQSEVVASTSTLPVLKANLEVGPAINQQQPVSANINQTPGPNNARNRCWKETQKATKLALKFGALDLKTGETRGDQSKA